VTVPKVDKVIFPSTTSDASRLLLPSLGCLALLGFAAGPGVQLATKKNGLLELLRRLMRKGLT
jgi:hypothetical protein